MVKKTKPNIPKGTVSSTVASSKKIDILNLFKEIDILPQIYFRILFGILLFIEMASDLSIGLVKVQWMLPINNFTYWPFDFVKPLEGNGMIYLFYAMAILALLFAVGFLYRISVLLLFIGYTYVFLLDQSYYLNHHYLICLILFVCIFLPLNRNFSVDTFLGLQKRSLTIPNWCLWLLRFMIALPYFFGGIAKVNLDWLRGQPLTMWVKSETQIPMLSSLFQYDWVGILMSYASLFLDLCIVPALLWKKTRIPFFIFICIFHIMNSQLFQIGIFPWLMLGSSVLFFPPESIRKFFKKIGFPIKEFLDPPKSAGSMESGLTLKQKISLTFICFWILVQLVVPLRHIFYPGNTLWTEAGSFYSWRMKLRDKKVRGEFTVMEKISKEKRPLPLSNYLTNRQQSIMMYKPDMIWQFAQMVKKKYNANGTDVAVFGNVEASLNGRVYQKFINSEIDLASVPRPGNTPAWVYPLTTPLGDRLKQ